MDLKNAARNVLKTIYAGKEEEPAETEKVPVTDTTVRPPYMSYLYFWAGKPIDFTNVQGYVEANPSTAMNTLDSGNFKWNKVVLKDSNENMIYIADLKEDGSLSANERIVNFKGQELNRQSLKDFDERIKKYRQTIFDNERLKFDQNPTYIDRDYNDNDLNSIIKNTKMPNTVGDFDQRYVVGSYRLRLAATTNLPSGVTEPILVGPKYERASPSDNFAGKNLAFEGTKEQMNYLEDQAKKAEQQKKPEAPAPKEETNFEPTDEQQKSTKQQVENKYKSAKDEKDSMIKELKKDDPDANYYTGDNSVMQDLVRRQHKKMKIRKSAAYTPGTPSTVPTAPTSTSTSKNKKSIPVHDMGQADENIENAEKLKQLGQKQQEVQKKINDINKNMPSITASVLTVKNVLSKYLKK